MVATLALAMGLFATTNIDVILAVTALIAAPGVDHRAAEWRIWAGVCRAGRHTSERSRCGWCHPNIAGCQRIMALVSSRCGYRPSGAFGAIGLILGSSADNLIATLAVFELGTIVLCAVAHLCSRNGL